MYMFSLHGMCCTIRGSEHILHSLLSSLLTQCAQYSVCVRAQVSCTSRDACGSARISLKPCSDEKHYIYRDLLVGIDYR